MVVVMDPRFVVAQELLLLLRRQLPRGRRTVPLLLVGELRSRDTPVQLLLNLCKK